MNKLELTPEDEGKMETAVSTPNQPPNQPAATLAERLILLYVALIALLLDQYTKYLVESNLALYDVYAPFPRLEPLFRIFHIPNKGATFGLFQGGGDIFRYLAIVVSLGILYYNFILPSNQRLLRLALGLQMGGALGNMIDRFRIGHVTDFIDIGPWYIFNIADLAVVSGAVILGIMVWQESRELKAQEQAMKEMEPQDSNLLTPQPEAIPSFPTQPDHSHE